MIIFILFRSLFREVSCVHLVELSGKHENVARIQNMDIGESDDEKKSTGVA